MSETLGHILESRRRTLGRTLAEAEADTKIRARLLEALEKGRYESLPSPAYVRGYVISYAKFLGLDPVSLVELYDKESGHARAAAEPVRLPEQVVPARGQGQHLPLRTALIVLAVLITLVGVVWGVSAVLSGPEEPPPIPTVPEPTSTPEPGDEPAIPGESEAPDETEEEPAVAEPFTLRVQIASDSASWLRVTVDGLVAYEGTMAGGQSQEWEVTEEASLRIGRPTAVTVYRDDVEQEIPEGDPPTLVLSATE